MGQAIGKVARWEAKEQAIFTFQMTFGNAGFIGLPICYALYGEQGSFWERCSTFPTNFSSGRWASGWFPKKATATGEIFKSQASLRSWG